MMYQGVPDNPDYGIQIPLNLINLRHIITSFDIPIPFTGAEFIIILQSENARGVRRLRPVKE
jgi:hypothetical protein